MNLTTCTDYKIALIQYVQEKKLKNKSISFESMAKYCGIQKTYLSKVLHKKGNLSLDQFFLACQYLKLTSKEFEFMENLFHFSTTNIELRKIKYQKLLEENKKEILKSENNLKLTSIIEKDVVFSYKLLIRLFLNLFRNYSESAFS